MEKKDIFQDIQNIRSSNPVIVLGSGASVSYGIPGMGVLANELKNFFKSNPYYDTATNDVVSDFIKLLDSGVGLEAALLDVKVPEIVEADIVNIVWKVIIESDAKVYERFISGEDINLRQLFDYIIYGDPNKTLNVISTNYDRIAEYAACQTDAYINIGFTHGLMGKLKDNIMLNPKKPEADYTGFINILKVHGSLDWYRRDGIICNIPNSVNIPLGFTPCIVTPGTNKYERTQEEPHRQLLSAVDKIFESAQNYVCIGYGFNDKHVQEMLLKYAKKRKAKILIVTKEITNSIGKYTMDESSIAYMDGDKLFQRHAAIVGSTGSGKSFCVACIVEQMAKLKHSNAILFDIHGEYSSTDFKIDGIKQYKIATPGDLATSEKLNNNILMVPYWLLNYEEMQALLLDRSDQNAPNQAMIFSREVLAEKEKGVEGTIYEHLITVDSPVAYDLQTVLTRLKSKDEEMVPGARAGSEKLGPYNGKLTRFNQRLENKLSDKRMGFMFSLQTEEKSQNWLKDFARVLMKADGGVKVIDMSEVPSDVLPLVIGLLARIVFTVQQWSSMEHRHPIALLCDEAHLYVQQSISQDAVAEIGLKSFERIAKEGRKYGVGLVIISQRPSEVNRTVLSQCNNFISLRLTNVDDQNVIKRLLPDNLGNIADNLSLLDIAEAIIVGDATLLPSRVKINEPSIKPSSQTVPFWSIWGKDNSDQDLSEAICNMIKQSK